MAELGAFGGACRSSGPCARGGAGHRALARKSSGECQCVCVCVCSSVCLSRTCTHARAHASYMLKPLAVRTRRHASDEDGSAAADGSHGSASGRSSTQQVVGAGHAPRAAASAPVFLAHLARARRTSVDGRRLQRLSYRGRARPLLLLAARQERAWRAALLLPAAVRP